MSQNPDDRPVVQPYSGFDCAQLSLKAAYRLLDRLVAPRPIAFVSTISSDGIPNLAPFSFFMALWTQSPFSCLSDSMFELSRP
jgi:flavin reductase (DIM6/NTAB) family NADH-FMN oxidoreductase RutF